MANKRVIAEKEGIYCPKCGSWNSSDWANCSSCVAPLPKRSTSEIGLSNFAILVSIIAVIISLYGAYQANVTLHASIKPILDTYADDYTKEKAVILHNYGMGPAVITDIRFYNNTTESRQLDEMIYWPYDVKFDTIQHFGDNFTYVQKEQEIILASITKDHLMQESKDKGANLRQDQIEEMMNYWAKEFSEVGVRVTYEDELGMKQKILERAFSFDNEPLNTT